MQVHSVERRSEVGSYCGRKKTAVAMWKMRELYDYFHISDVIHWMDGPTPSSMF
jgi:hypothetical protein